MTNAETKIDLILAEVLRIAQTVARIEAQPAEPVAPVISGPWSGLSADDPIGPYDQTDAGLFYGFRQATTPEQIIGNAWHGSAPDGRVLNSPGIKLARKQVLALLAAKPGDPALAPYISANIEPNLALVLILLGEINPEQPNGGIFGVGKRVSNFANQNVQAWVDHYLSIGGAPGIGGTD